MGSPYIDEGFTYDMAYKRWHHDPLPHLFVISSNGKYTQGFNLHYIPFIRRRRPDEAYRPLSPAVWQAVYEDMKLKPYFSGFIKFLEEQTQGAGNILEDGSWNIDLGRTDTNRIMKVVQARWPVFMKSYRNYLSDYIIILRKYNQPGAF